jgi:hypothetical protein
MMKPDPDMEDVPDWLSEETLEQIAADLNEQLRDELYNSSLHGSPLGETLGQRLTVSKFDNLHGDWATPEEQYDAGDEELTRITTILSEKLKRHLLEYGASEEDVEFAVVRRWDLLAGGPNACRWVQSTYNPNTHSWCAMKQCC